MCVFLLFTRLSFSLCLSLTSLCLSLFLVPALSFSLFLVLSLVLFLCLYPCRTHILQPCKAPWLLQRCPSHVRPRRRFHGAVRALRGAGRWPQRPRPGLQRRMLLLPLASRSSSCKQLLRCQCAHMLHALRYGCCNFRVLCTRGCQEQPGKRELGERSAPKSEVRGLASLHVSTCRIRVSSLRLSPACSSCSLSAVAFCIPCMYPCTRACVCLREPVALFSIGLSLSSTASFLSVSFLSLGCAHPFLSLFLSLYVFFHLVFSPSSFSLFLAQSLAASLSFLFCFSLSFLLSCLFLSTSSLSLSSVPTNLSQLPQIGLDTAGSAFQRPPRVCAAPSWTPHGRAL